MQAYFQGRSFARAMRFDGLDETAFEIEALFPRRVARKLGDRYRLVVIGTYGLLDVAAGDWVVEDQMSQILRVWPDEDFRAAYSPVLRLSAAPCDWVAPSEGGAGLEGGTAQVIAWRATPATAKDV